MSYPYDNPSNTLSGIWNNGSYTPEDVVANIRDNYSPVNKNTMRNSVGEEISRVQNFVNSKYLGRSSLPIESGFISTLTTDSGYFEYTKHEKIVDSVTHYCDIGYSDSMYVQVGKQETTPTKLFWSKMIDDRFYQYMYNAVGQAGETYMDPSGVTFEIDREYPKGWLNLITNSGIYLGIQNSSNTDKFITKVLPSGVEWERDSSTADYNTMGIYANPSGETMEFKGVSDGGVTLYDESSPFYGFYKGSGTETKTNIQNNNDSFNVSLSNIPSNKTPFLLGFHVYFMSPGSINDQRIPANMGTANGVTFGNGAGGLGSVYASGESSVFFEYQAHLCKGSSSTDWDIVVGPISSGLFDEYTGYSDIMYYDYVVGVY